MDTPIIEKVPFRTKDIPQIHGDILHLEFFYGSKYKHNDTTIRASGFVPFPAIREYFIHLYYKSDSELSAMFDENDINIDSGYIDDFLDWLSPWVPKLEKSQIVAALRYIARFFPVKNAVFSLDSGEVTFLNCGAPDDLFVYIPRKEASYSMQIKSTQHLLADLCILLNLRLRPSVQGLIVYNLSGAELFALLNLYFVTVIKTSRIS